MMLCGRMLRDYIVRIAPVRVENVYEAFRPLFDDETIRRNLWQLIDGGIIRLSNEHMLLP